MKEMNIQKTTDHLFDKYILRYIPKTVRPNQVTIIRFILVPVVYTLLRQRLFVPALIVFLIAALTDGIDGAMARTRNQITDIGKTIDPIADKLLILSVLLFIGFKYLIVTLFSLYIVFEIIAVLFGYLFSSVIGKPLGANIFGKIKLNLQVISVTLFIIGLVGHNRTIIILSTYILYAALAFAVLAGIEVARRKLIQWKEEGTFKAVI